MASLNSHRKLANSNSNSNSTTTTVQTCLQFCDSEKNTTSSLYSGFCPQVCLAICPSLCTYPLTNLPLPEDYNPSNIKKSHNLSPLLISMLILLATTFLLIILYVIYTKLYFHFYAPHRSNSFRPRSRRGGRVGSDSRDEEHGSRVVFNPFWCIPTVGLPATVINSIAVHKYGKEMEERDCAVCLAEFKEGDELRVLPKCNHAFHVPCIDTWLSSHTTCPLCRAPIIPPDHQNQNHGHDHDKAEDTSAALPTVEEATEENSSAEVLRISIVSGEEGVDGNNLEESMDNSASNKDQENSEEISKGSCSQRWSLERGAANLVTRSLSCSGKIFSSRSNSRPSPNS